jgi:hypothetical protein
MERSKKNVQSKKQENEEDKLNKRRRKEGKK